MCVVNYFHYLRRDKEVKKNFSTIPKNKHVHFSHKKHTKPRGVSRELIKRNVYTACESNQLCLLESRLHHFVIWIKN